VFTPATRPDQFGRPGHPGAGRFETAVAAFVDRLGPARSHALALAVADGRPDDDVAAALPVPGFAEAAREVLAARRAQRVPDAEAVAYLRGVAGG
jgi:hypothetical protein